MGAAPDDRARHAGHRRVRERELGGRPEAADRRGRRCASLGLDGDGHHNPDVHGGVRAAVCLYPQEAIERVRADGHAAFPGSYGDNLTLLGIDWATLRRGRSPGAGRRREPAPSSSSPSTPTPCSTQAPWFTEGRIARISHKVHPEDARWYARVLREGPVAPGMTRPGSLAPRAERRYPSHHHRRIHWPTPRRPASTPAATRETLLAQHAEARRRRNAAELGSARMGARVRRRGPDRDRDRPHRAGDGPAQGLRGDRRRDPRRDPVATPEAPASAPIGRPVIVRPMDSVVLLLNADYEPLNVCDVRRAFRLVFGQKAEVIQYNRPWTS